MDEPSGRNVRLSLVLVRSGTDAAITDSLPYQRLCLLSRARELTPIRVEFITHAVELCGATLSEIARFLHRDPSVLSKLLACHKAPIVTP